MEISELMMSLLVFSAVAVGLGSFYVGTAATYSLQEDQLSEFSGTFNKYSAVDAKLKKISLALSNIQGVNILTWGNVVIIVINVFEMLLTVPLLFHSLLVDIVTMTFLPAWVTWFVEGVVLIIVVFGILNAINKWRM